MGKRGATPGSPMRKLRKTHPMYKNLTKVENALHDHSVPVPGSKLNRKMLIEALPKALGDGAASDERHGYQKMIVDAIGEVLSAEVKKCADKVATGQAEYDAASAEKTTSDNALAEKQGLLDAKKTEITEKKEVLSTDKQAHKDAEHALKEANHEVEHFDGNMKKKEDDKTKFETALNETLASLKKGEYATPKEKKAAEGKGIETLKSILAVAGADDSLLVCFSVALTKDPEKRGAFDNRVIKEIETRIEKTIAGLASELAQGPSLKDKKIAEAAAALTKKDASVAKQEASAEAVKVAEQEKHDLDAVVKTATHEMKEKTHTQEAKLKILTKEKSCLEEAEASQEAFKYLVDRPSVEPEPEEEKKDEPMEEAPAAGEDA